ncbi:TetR/AcrR family transcriptional regulator [Thalassolituus hydrocarboniclasticus]|uniref:TetR/AcrR family transcriptional regulator n=1 Tax=Thalassolituus hydrocarboniclasticus TaxID=2742796 RepID=A0ABY6AAM9_9GAMM|nr:TetR/AcrR family transcriptional regulator [Thalassolituus hydrocarboniclasticus]UXD87341.1 TetR/AcrR family transcriptional regulator [Thalassolituus hydrocarboniclasticus]
MARRQDHTPVQLQQLTMDTVLALLQQQPASSLSLRQIAREVGYSPGTLINQFGSYGLLLLAANARTLDQIYRELCAAIEQADSPQQALEACAMSYLNFASQHPHQWRLLFEHQLPEQENLPDWQQQRIDNVFTLLQQQLAILKPGTTAADCAQTARTIWASVHGICVLALDDKLFTPGNISGNSMILSLLHHYLPGWINAKEDRHA